MHLASACPALLVPLTLAACATARAAPEPSPTPIATTCNFPEVALRNTPGKKVGTWGELAVRLAPDAKVASVDDAIGAVCAGMEGCSATSLAFCDHDVKTTCYVRAPTEGAPWYAFEDVLIQHDNGLTVKSALAPDRRFVQVSLSLEMLGRIEDALCETAEDGSSECVSATGSFGWHHVDLVIDLTHMTLAWDAVFVDYDEFATGDLRCKHPHEITFEGTTVARTSCEGRRERFAVKDLAACTVAARDAYLERTQNERTAKQRGNAAASAKVASDLVAKGRKLSKAKDYAGAIKAFDEAITAHGRLTTALSGRGYARLLRAEGGDLVMARSDFEEALQSEPHDQKFRGAVMFNLGTLCEKEKRAAEARSWFEKSHAQNPTAATAKKLGL